MLRELFASSPFKPVFKTSNLTPFSYLFSSYYQFVLSPSVAFGADGTLSSVVPAARFTNMPQKPILTLGMDPPEGWLVEAVWAPYDLDNIHLTEVSFSLSNVLLLLLSVS